MSDTPPVMKHPISFAEAEASAEKYLNAPPDALEAQLDFLCDLVGTDTLEDVQAKA